MSQDPSRRERLLASTDMPPVTGTVDVALPAGELWRCFARPHLWPRWNRSFRWVKNRDLVLGARLNWIFNPIRPEYLYKMPAAATIVELEPERKVTWEVTVLPGFYARHTYHLEDLGNGRTRFGNWEQAMGPTLRLTRAFWVKHFTFVMDASLGGVERLAAVYKERGSLAEEHLPAGPG